MEGNTIHVEPNGSVRTDMRLSTIVDGQKAELGKN